MSFNPNDLPPLNTDIENQPRIVMNSPIKNKNSPKRTPNNYSTQMSPFAFEVNTLGSMNNNHIGYPVFTQNIADTPEITSGNPFVKSSREFFPTPPIIPPPITASLLRQKQMNPIFHFNNMAPAKFIPQDYSSVPLVASPISLTGNSILAPSDITTSMRKPHRSKSVVGTSCHQCKVRRAPSDLIHCSRLWQKKSNAASMRLCQKKFCVHCLVKHYGITDFSNMTNWFCPCCTDSCTCIGCEHKKSKKKNNFCMSGVQKQLDAHLESQKKKEEQEIRPHIPTASIQPSIREMPTIARDK